MGKFNRLKKILQYNYNFPRFAHDRYRLGRLPTTEGLTQEFDKEMLL